MKHISILVLKDATMVSIDGTLQMLSRINDFLRYHRKEPFYNIELVGLTKNIKINNGTYSIQSDKLLKDIKRTDLIIIPTICGDYTRILKANSNYKDWIIEQYHSGAELVSLCVGSFFLASTGLLDG